MKKFVVLLAVFCAMSATAADNAALAKQLTEKVWGVSEESVIEVADVATTQKSGHTLTLDVACDGTTAAFGLAEPPAALLQGMPFIVSGYIYPEGTFTANGRNRGVLAGGGPAWPELQLGLWICRGWNYGASAVTTQMFQWGDNQLFNDGIEGGFPTVNVRAITGGAGDYLLARGEMDQLVVGLNVTQTPNFTYTFHFRNDINFKGE